MKSEEGTELQAAYYKWCAEALPEVFKKLHVGPNGSFVSAIIMTDANTDGTAAADPSVRP